MARVVGHGKALRYLKQDGTFTWPIDARASSSNGPGFGAQAAIGPPRNYLPPITSVPGAWSPQPAERHIEKQLDIGLTEEPTEWLEVEFPPGTRASAVWIFETGWAGQIVSVSDTSTVPPTVLSAHRDPNVGSPKVTAVPVDPPREIRRVRIDLQLSSFPPQIDAVGLENADGAERRKTRSALFRRARLGIVAAAATLTTWSCVAPAGLVVGQVAPLRVVSGTSADELAPGATWASGGQYEGFDAEHIVGPPDQRSLPLSFSSNPRSNAKRLLHAVVTFADAVDARSIVLVETNPFAVVRVDDVSSRLQPVTVWRGATSEPRRGDHGVVRIDLPEPRPISQLRLVFDRDIVRGQLDAVGLVPR